MCAGAFRRSEDQRRQSIEYLRLHLTSSPSPVSSQNSNSREFKLQGNCSPPSLATNAVTPKSLTLKGSSWPPKHLVSYISLATPLKKSQKRSCSHLKNILFNIWKFAGTLSKLGCPKILKLWRWAVSIIIRARQRNSLVLVFPPRKLLPLKFWKRNKRFSRLHLLPNTHFIPKPGMFCQNLLSWNSSFFRLSSIYCTSTFVCGKPMFFNWCKHLKIFHDDALLWNHFNAEMD